MEFGYGLITCQRYPRNPRTSTDIYREAIEIAKRCDSAGLDSIWTSEHHLWDDDYMPSLLILSAAFAAATDRIKIGTGVLLAPLYHPIRLAEDAATVDIISNGRLILGLGLGWRQEEFDRLGIPMEGLGRRLTETVKILRASWGSEVFEFDGKYFNLGPTNVTPKPPRKIPIWIGGFVDGAMRRAGRIGDAWFGSTVPLEDLERRVGIVKEGLDKSGRDHKDFTFALHEPVFVSEDPEKELDDFLPHYHYSRWKYRDMGAEFGRGSSGPLPQPPPLDEETKARLSEGLIFGTPSDVAKKVREFGEILGEGCHFVARADYPGVSLERNLRTVELLAQVKTLLA